MSIIDQSLHQHQFQIICTGALLVLTTVAECHDCVMVHNTIMICCHLNNDILHSKSNSILITMLCLFMFVQKLLDARSEDDEELFTKEVSNGISPV